MKKDEKFFLFFSITFIATGFIGFCLTTGQVVRGDILAPSPEINQMALLASIFILIATAGLMGYKYPHFIKKTDS